MSDERSILTLKLDSSDVDEWLDKNKLLIISETVSSIEDMILTGKSKNKVIDVYIYPLYPGDEPMMMELEVYLDDIRGTIDDLLQKTVLWEEYELAHRVKLLKEYLTI
jgi:hypothetical protein